MSNEWAWARIWRYILDGVDKASERYRNEWVILFSPDVDSISKSDFMRGLRRDWKKYVNAHATVCLAQGADSALVSEALDIFADQYDAFSERVWACALDQMQPAIDAHRRKLAEDHAQRFHKRNLKLKGAVA